MNHTQAHEGVVDELLRERREEAQADAAPHPLTMTREQFAARLDALHERTLRGQAQSREAKRTAKQREKRRAT